MFGPYNNYKERATLVSPVVEFEFSPGRRFNPYVVVGAGYTQDRALEPNVQHYYDPSLPEFAWRKEGGINLAGGLGFRFFVTKGFFVAPELRIGWVPLLRSTVSFGYEF